MAAATVKKRIRDVLRKAFFSDPDDLVHVSDGAGDDVHVVVISDKFRGKRMKAKNDLIWEVLTSHLDASEWGRVTLSVGASPEQLKAL